MQLPFSLFHRSSNLSPSPTNFSMIELMSFLYFQLAYLLNLHRFRIRACFAVGSCVNLSSNDTLAFFLMQAITASNIAITDNAGTRHDGNSYRFDYCQCLLERKIGLLRVRFLFCYCFFLRFSYSQIDYSYYEDYYQYCKDVQYIHYSICLIALRIVLILKSVDGCL
jgi:hypothetical protein